MHTRNTTRQLKIGSLTLGGGAPVRVQSMTNTPTHEVEPTLKQIHSLAQAGAELVRLAVPDERAAAALCELVERSPVPLVADIHFSADLALASLQAGVAKLRLNPGTLQDKRRIREIAALAKERGTPIRVGANAGSLPKRVLQRYGGPTALALAEAALEEAAFLEKLGFDQLCISVKAFEVPKVVEATRLVAERCDYPLHLGVTEAGTPATGLVRSAVGLGILLAEGLGDTIRVSLTGDPVIEVETAWQILTSLELRQHGPILVSCPTCGRKRIDVAELADKVRNAVRHVKQPVKLAVMGCEVNGPGEASTADLGLCGTPSGYMLFRKGKPIGKFKFGEADPVKVFLQELDRLLAKGADESAD